MEFQKYNVKEKKKKKEKKKSQKLLNIGTKLITNTKKQKFKISL